MREDPLYYEEYSRTPLLERFLHASRGIKNAWRKEPNFRIQVMVAFAVFGAMAILPLTNTDRAVLTIIIVFVLALEIINSIIERVLDIVHPDFSEEVKKIKDTMAGSVFLASLAAIVVGLFILTQPLLRFDTHFYQNIISHLKTGMWVEVAGYITLLGDAFVIAGFTVTFSLYLLYKKKYELLSFLLGSVVLGQAFLLFLKWVFGRERPIAVDFYLQVSDYSFPSGHVFSGTVLYMALAYILSRNGHKGYIWILPSVFIPAIAFSRIALSVHWLSDVVGGFLFGSFWLLMWFGINKRLFIKFQERNTKEDV